MTAKELLGAAALLIGFIGYGPYFLSIWKGKTRPHAFSWIVWSLIDLIAFLAQLNRGAGPGAWATASGVFFCVAVALCGITRGEKNISRGDRIAFFMSLAALLPWYLTGDPLWTVIWIAIINTIAYYPTIRKSWLKPYEENLWPYAGDAIKFAMASFALDHYSATTMITPISIVLGNGFFIGINIWRRSVLARTTK